MKAIKLNMPAVLVAAAIVLLALVLSVLLFKPVAPAEGATNVFAAPVVQQATTTSSFSVTTSARVLATTTNALGLGTSYTREYATICNSNSNPVALLFDQDKPANLAAGRVTVWIAAAAGYNACYEVNNLPYIGSVTASSTNQTATTITVADYVY